MFDFIKDYFDKRKALTSDEIEAEKINTKKNNAYLHFIEFIDKFKKASAEQCQERLNRERHYLKEPSYNVRPNQEVVAIHIECEFCGYVGNELLPLDTLEEVKKHFKKRK